MKQDLYIQSGPPARESGRALIMIHGRGASAEDILGLATYLPVNDFTLAAPQAAGGSWYPYSFIAPVGQNQPYLNQSLSTIADVHADLNQQGISDENIYWLGFSQGACLTLEYTTRNARRYGGVVAFTGGLIGAELQKDLYAKNFEGTPVLIASSDPDPHVPVSRVIESAEIIEGMHANLLTRIYKGMGHTVTQDEIREAASHIFNSVNQ